MRRFVVCGGVTYYPKGGMEDFLDSFDDREQAIAFAKGFMADGDSLKWVHVYDTQERVFVHKE